MTKRIVYIITCILALPFTGKAQEMLTLEDAIGKALEYNYDIRIVKNEARQAAVNNTLGNAGFSPNINANGGISTGTSNTRIEFADGRVQEVPNAASFGINGAVTLNWTLFDGGRMFIVKKQLNVLERLGEARLKEQVQATVSQVIQAYAASVWQKQQGVAIDTGLVLAQVRMMLSQVKYETGASAKIDYLQARVDYNSRRADSLSQLASLNASFATLNALMGEDPDKTYILEDTLHSDMDLEPSDKQRFEQMNPSLEAARRSVEAYELGAKIARTYHLPTLAVNGAYNYTRTRSQSGFALFNQSYGPQGSAAISVPIFQGGNIRRQAKIASLQAMREQLVYDRQNTEIGRQYRTAWRNYEVAVAAYKLEQENIGYAKENMDIQKARFRVGIATTLETREAENSYVQALVRLYTAAYNLKVNETIVLQLEGTLVK
ncbi:MAG TPA: TolC family protein [Flavipsychrobacter sp.]